MIYIICIVNYNMYGPLPQDEMNTKIRFRQEQQNKHTLKIK